ncbi:FIMAH domain-containing protein [Bacillus niameyensis]|uniref:FIMAH domain-containing protein n=1 Tax=Bacillus niameyensis TaxID=1522308 RepID=UPI00078205BD|nr:carbohydrate binding domain-containing protein [Bacillus niameyensis]
MKIKRSLSKIMLVAFSCLLMLPFGGLNSKASAAQTLPEFSPERDITAPLSGSPTIYDGAAGKEDGLNVLYTTSKSIPAMFSVIDLDNQKVLRTLPLEGAADSWHHEVAPDGTVYIAAGNHIWGYSPETKEVKALADIPESSLWALSVDEESNAYIGTYPSGKVFKYTKSSGELRDYGKMIGDINQEYVRSMDYHGGYVYAGTGHKKIMKLNVETGEKVDIAVNATGSIAEQFAAETSFVYDLNIVDDRYLFARYSVSQNMYIYDLQAEKWLDVVMPNVTGLHVTDSLESNVYFVADKRLKYINLETLEIQETAMEYGSGLRGADWVEIKGDERLPGKSLVTITFDGRAVFFNIETESVVTYPQIVPSSANVINQISTYSDDKIYISGMTGAIGAVFNPKTETYENISLGQADVIHKYDDKMYFGMYPSGSVRMIDPEQNPLQAEELFIVGEEQERLHHMASGDGKLFVGSIPTYNKLGGAITVYDGTSHTVYRNVVQDQSINGLAYKDGKLYGSTSITGGLGSVPTADEAVVFIWDPVTGEKVKERTLNIEGLNKPSYIGDLKVGPNDDYIWGASRGYIFAMEQDTLEIAKVLKLEENASEGAWHRVQLEFSKDGFLYAKAGNNLYVINPETLDFKFITHTWAFDLGEDGNIYLSKQENRTVLSKIEVIDPTEYEWKPIPFTNQGFESDLDGWTSMFGTADDANFEISTDVVFSGEQSLKINDQSRSISVALYSENIPVVPGQEYLGEVMMNIVSGQSSFLLRMYDENNKQLKEEVVHTDSGYDKWQKIEQKIIAPENAAYARVFALSTSYALTEAYFDDFGFYEKVDAQEPGIDLTELEELIAAAQAISSDEYTAVSFASLQTALKNAEAALENIQTEEELAKAIANLQSALDNLISIAELNTTYMLATLDQYQDELPQETYRALSIHLTSIGLYEKQENGTKLLKHLESFKLLIDIQKEKQLISDELHGILSADADSLLLKWQGK